MNIWDKLWLGVFVSIGLICLGTLLTVYNYAPYSLIMILLGGFFMGRFQRMMEE